MSFPKALEVSVNQARPMRLQGELQCQPGQLLALVGPSGAGKSSMLRVIAGLMPSRDATVRLGDALWSDPTRQMFLTAQQRRVGMVFQNYALMPHLDALENVALAAQGNQDRAASLLLRMGLDKAQTRRRPAELSGGQQQRVALARALARDPQVLLLDEPFSAVDRLTRQVLYRELSELKHSMGLPIIMVTHDLDEARLLCDRMAVMDDGMVLQTGSPDSIYGSPRNHRVAELVGIENRFHGVFVQRGAGAKANQPGTGLGLMRWGRHPENPLLKIVDKGRIDVGRMVTWVVSGDGFRLLPRKEGLSESGEKALDESQANLWPAVVVELRSLGEIRLCKVRIDLPEPQEVTLTLSSMNMPEVSLTIGAKLSLSLDSLKIHVMPARSEATPGVA